MLEEQAEPTAEPRSISATMSPLTFVIFPCFQGIPPIVFSGFVCVRSVVQQRVRGELDRCKAARVVVLGAEHLPWWGSETTCLSDE